MKNKTYSSGQVAALTGLTIRSIQYYDQIGLLPSSGRTEGGRRIYQESDLVQLAQIMMYKKLGFSLTSIKKELLLCQNSEDLLGLLEKQAFHLLSQIEQLNTAFATIQAMSEVLEWGVEPSFAALLKSLQFLPQDSIFKDTHNFFSDQDRSSLQRSFQDVEDAQAFYHKWKKIMIEAAVFQESGLAADHFLVQELAERWWQLTASFAQEHGEEAVEKIKTMGLENQLTEDQTELNRAQAFLEAALRLYLQKQV
ncbi:Transcriptional regulator, MerR family [Streptococcus sp. DD11]|uniref:MerR family transcriptional regulator n=1 Tax=Streptococcus sp. DD11 TaxID=1777879 RepID=UPI0007983CD6|nr:MerR family transcriptional regulator [Streptococcus sp. DD11]KXT85472.1 Transcriptional regulator, MerR family [Streptococcus sp. DD11]